MPQMSSALPFLLLLLLCTTAHAMPSNSTGSVAAKAPMLTPPTHSVPTLNSADITLFTNMFLSLFKSIADSRNMVAADVVQSVWQSPPVVDFSKRIFAIK